ncbi:MAG: hypothetical protein R2762_23495 [Bryobacteraceae bacterium]
MTLTRRTATLSFGACALLAIGAFAAPEGDSKTVTGCLTKAPMPGQYVIEQEATGQKMMVRGSADLEKHSGNHKVKLTGDTVEAGGHSVFEVSAVEHISDTCAVPKK